MPTYVYRREDGTTFEIKQRITEDALETCPETGQPVERLISGSAGLIFKGEGFYVTDYVRNSANGKKAEGKKSPESEASEGSDASAKTSSSSSENSGSKKTAKTD